MEPRTLDTESLLALMKLRDFRTVVWHREFICEPHA